MNCHWTTDKKTGTKFFLPGCMGGAVRGKIGCTCLTLKQRKRKYVIVDAIEGIGVDIQNHKLIDLTRELAALMKLERLSE